MIATVDVVYELAFPIMDLVHFGQRVPANRLLNSYLQQTWRDNGPAVRLLPLFQSIRPAVRSHVLFTKREQSTDDDSAAVKAKALFRPGSPIDSTGTVFLRTERAGLANYTKPHHSAFDEHQIL